MSIALHVPKRIATLFNSGMDLEEATRTNRRAWLLRLIERMGSAAELARRTDTDSAHLSQIKQGYREMGEAVARRIENKLILLPGSLDFEPPQDLPLLLEQDRAKYSDPQFGRLADLYQKLTQAQRDLLLKEIEALALANETVIRELSKSLNRPTRAEPQ